MAMGICLFCESCGFRLMAWDEGNPYFINENGVKEYAYHPDGFFRKCIGNDAPHMCLACGEEFTVDSLRPRRECTKCGSFDTVNTFLLEGKKCPKCGIGVIKHESDGFLIS